MVRVRLSVQVVEFAGNAIDILLTHDQDNN